MTAVQGFTRLKQHPLSAAFPSIPEDEIDALAEDIKKHGQREPGVVLDDMVLDGWHRFLACDKAGVAFVSVQYKGEDPVAFVLSKNLRRRHLNASQRAQVVVAAHSWRGRGIKSALTADYTAKSLAEKAEVSERTIEHAKTAERAGLGDAVREGKVSAARAAEVAKLPKAKREKAVKAIEAGEPPAPKEKKPNGDVAKVRAELIDLQGKYADLLEKNAELADTATELNDKLAMYEATQPDEQQKLIADLQLKLRRKEAEIDRQRVQIRDANNKCNELIRQVKRLQKNG